MLAMVAVLVWLATETGQLHSAAQYAIVLSTVVTIGFNANPLMRYDGYFILCDLVNIPNLHRDAKAAGSGFIPPPESLRQGKFIRQGKQLGTVCRGYDPTPTINYLHAAVVDACQNFGGDTSRLNLCGFSRGSIACKFIGLHDDKTGNARPVKTKADWAERVSHLQANMQLVLGALPDASRRVSLDVQHVSEETLSNYRRLKILFTPEPNDRVPAWLLIPKAKEIYELFDIDRAAGPMRLTLSTPNAPHDFPKWNAMQRTNG